MVRSRIRGGPEIGGVRNPGGGPKSWRGPKSEGSDIEVSGTHQPPATATRSGGNTTLADAHSMHSMVLYSHGGTVYTSVVQYNVQCGVMARSNNTPTP